ncbi:UNVERIFIED_CONTAM: hypothetical protein PYX00_008546 [Menopon gallinae]|uniref:Gustatory receptor n=1 Tax=Menopon gallinae TaxID=328185 RepID=A0AAW2HNG4_9NEOP
MRRRIIGENILFSFSVTGIIPIQRDENYRINKKLVVYCRVVIAVLFGLQYFMMHVFQHMTTNSKFMSLIASLNSFGYCICCWSRLLSIHTRSPDVCKVMNTLVEHRRFRPSTVCGSSLLTEFLVLNYVIAECGVFFVALYVTMSQWNKPTSEKGIIVRFIMDYYFSSCDYLFLLICLNLYHIYKDTSKQLAQLLTIRNSVGRGRKYDSEQFRSLCNFHTHYSKLFDLVDEINDIFSKSNLMSFSYNPVLLVYLLFWAAQDEDNDDLPQVTPGRFVFWLYYYFSKTGGCLLVIKRIQQEYLNKALVAMCRKRQRFRRGVRFLYEEYQKVLDILNNINDCFSQVNFISILVGSCGNIFLVTRLTKLIALGNEPSDNFNKSEKVFFIYFFLTKAFCTLLITSMVEEQIEHSSFVLNGMYSDVGDTTVKEDVISLFIAKFFRKLTAFHIGFLFIVLPGRDSVPDDTTSESQVRRLRLLQT